MAVKSDRPQAVFILTAPDVGDHLVVGGRLRVQVDDLELAADLIRPAPMFKVEKPRLAVVDQWLTGIYTLPLAGLVHSVLLQEQGSR